MHEILENIILILKAINACLEIYINLTVFKKNLFKQIINIVSIQVANTYFLFSLLQKHSFQPLYG